MHYNQDHKVKKKVQVVICTTTFAVQKLPHSVSFFFDVIVTINCNFSKQL
jgi:hypothetical protein